MLFIVAFLTLVRGASSAVDTYATVAPSWTGDGQTHRPYLLRHTSAQPSSQVANDSVVGPKDRTISIPSLFNMPFFIMRPTKALELLARLVALQLLMSET